MRRALISLVLACSCVTVDGHAIKTANLARLRQRAAFDLTCPEAQVQVTELGVPYQDPYGALGCGRRATYLWDSQTGSWHMNSPVTAFENKAP